MRRFEKKRYHYSGSNGPPLSGSNAINQENGNNQSHHPSGAFAANSNNSNNNSNHSNRRDEYGKPNKNRQHRGSFGTTNSNSTNNSNVSLNLSQHTNPSHGNQGGSKYSRFNNSPISSPISSKTSYSQTLGSEHGSFGHQYSSKSQQRNNSYPSYNTGLDLHDDINASGAGSHDNNSSAITNRGEHTMGPKFKTSDFSVSGSRWSGVSSNKSKKSRYNNTNNNKNISSHGEELHNRFERRSRIPKDSNNKRSERETLDLATHASDNTKHNGHESLQTAGPLSSIKSEHNKSRKSVTLDSYVPTSSFAISSNSNDAADTPSIYESSLSVQHQSHQEHNPPEHNEHHSGNSEYGKGQGRSNRGNNNYNASSRYYTPSYGSQSDSNMITSHKYNRRENYDRKQFNSNSISLANSAPIGNNVNKITQKINDQPPDIQHKDEYKKEKIYKNSPYNNNNKIVKDITEFSSKDTSTDKNKPEPTPPKLIGSLISTDNNTQPQLRKSSLDSISRSSSLTKAEKPSLIHPRKPPQNLASTETAEIQKTYGNSKDDKNAYINSEYQTTYTGGSKFIPSSGYNNSVSDMQTEETDVSESDTDLTFAKEEDLLQKIHHNNIHKKDFMQNENELKEKVSDAHGASEEPKKEPSKLEFKSNISSSDGGNLVSTPDGRDSKSFNNSLLSLYNSEEESKENEQDFNELLLSSKELVVVKDPDFTYYDPPFKSTKHIPKSLSSQEEPLPEPKEPLGEYIFPMTEVKLRLWILKNDPKNVSKQKYLLKTPIKTLNEYPFFYENIKQFKQDEKNLIVDNISKLKRYAYIKSLKLRDQYFNAEQAWNKNVVSKLDSLTEQHKSREEKEHEAKLKNEEEKTTTQDDPESAGTNSSGGSGSRDSRENRNSVGSGTSSRRRNRADFVDEQDLESVLLQIDPFYKHHQLAAEIPAMILNPLEKHSIKFKDVNNLITDKDKWAERIILDSQLNFSELEHDLFTEGFMQYPKLFSRISNFMSGLRSPEDCVLYYYQTKNKYRYKELLEERKKEKERERAKKRLLRKTSKTESGNTTPMKKQESGVDLTSISKEVTGKELKDKLKEFLVSQEHEQQKITDDTNNTVASNSLQEKDDSLKKDQGLVLHETGSSALATAETVTLSSEPVITADGLSDSVTEVSKIPVVEDDSFKPEVEREPDSNNTTEEVIDMHDSNESGVKKHLISNDVDSSGKTSVVLPADEFQEGSILDGPSMSRYDMNSSTTPKPENAVISQNHVTFASPLATIAHLDESLPTEKMKKRKSSDDGENTQSKISKKQRALNGEAVPGITAPPLHKSSYWSVYETNLFPSLLAKHGSNWEAISKDIGTKSVTMVRNFYQKRSMEHGWQEIVRKHASGIKQDIPVPGFPFTGHSLFSTGERNTVEQTPSATALTGLPVATQPSLHLFSKENNHVLPINDSHSKGFVEQNVPMQGLPAPRLPSIQLPKLFKHDNSPSHETPLVNSQNLPAVQSSSFHLPMLERPKNMIHDFSSKTINQNLSSNSSGLGGAQTDNSRKNLHIGKILNSEASTQQAPVLRQYGSSVSNSFTSSSVPSPTEPTSMINKEPVKTSFFSTILNPPAEPPLVNVTPTFPSINNHLRNDNNMASLANVSSNSPTAGSQSHTNSSTPNSAAPSQIRPVIRSRSPINRVTNISSMMNPTMQVQPPMSFPHPLPQQKPQQSFPVHAASPSSSSSFSNLNFAIDPLAALAAVASSESKLLNEKEERKNLNPPN